MRATFETDDLTDPKVIADPYQYFGGLRETDPVHWNPLFEGWIVTRYSDVVWVIRHHDLFSSDVPWMEPREEYPPIDEADWELVESMKTFRSFIFFDQPEHLEMRRSIHRWFTPKAIEKWRAQLQVKVQELIDVRCSDGQMEVRSDLATPLPLMTICWMMAVPTADALLLRDLTTTVLGDSFTPDRMRVMTEARRELHDYFTPLIDTRAKNPGEDLVSMLADGERRGVFTRDQCLANITLLLTAGHETTLNLICNGVLAFIRNPEQWDLLQSNPDGMCALATEECLRYDPPAKFFPFRVSTQDIELRGKQIRAGDKVAYVPASANRDPRVFSNPDMFDITRSPNPHLAFGGGIHHCLGASLARIEGQETFKALATTLPRLRLQNDEVEYVPRLIERAVHALHVFWD